MGAKFHDFFLKTINRLGSTFNPMSNILQYIEIYCNIIADTIYLYFQ